MGKLVNGTWNMSSQIPGLVSQPLGYPVRIEKYEKY